MLKAIKVEDISRDEKEKYVKKYIAIYAELISNEELDELYMATESAFSSWHKGRRQ